MIYNYINIHKKIIYAKQKHLVDKKTGAAKQSRISSITELRTMTDIKFQSSRLEYYHI